MVPLPSQKTKLIGLLSKNILNYAQVNKMIGVWHDKPTGPAGYSLKELRANPTYMYMYIVVSRVHKIE